MQEQAFIFPLELRASMTWQQVSDWLKRQGGTITTILVIFGALFAGIRYIVGSEVAEIRSDVATLKGDSKAIDDKLGTTNQRIDGLLKEALERAFPHPSAVKSDMRDSLATATDLLRVAQSEHIKLNPSLVADYGRELTYVRGDSRTWKSLNQALEYYSSILDVDLRKFILIRATDPSSECFNPDNAKGLFVAGMLFENCTQHLDRLLGPAAISRDVLFKDLAFRNVRVIYSGGPLRMDNVYFVNCTFDLEPTKPGKVLAWTFLTEERAAHFQWPPL